jgi:hypothetical protein
MPESATGTLHSVAGHKKGRFNYPELGYTFGMHVKRYHALIGMLLLALVVLPGQSLYAQSKMLPLSADSHACHHMEKQAGLEKAQPPMKCCQEDQSRCNQSCGDCFHCSSLIAVLSVPLLPAEKNTFSYARPARDTRASLPASGQFRPPRLTI